MVGGSGVWGSWEDGGGRRRVLGGFRLIWLEVSNLVVFLTFRFIGLKEALG